MEIGAAIFFTDYSMARTELAVALEERGFDSLWVAEHSHIPVTRRFTHPLGDAALTKEYFDVMDPRERTAQSLAENPLVRIVEEGEQQRDRHCLKPGPADRCDDAIDIPLVERGHDLSLRVDPLGDLEAPAPRHQHRRRVLKEVVEVGARGPAQLQHVAKAACRDETRPCSFLLQQRVGDDRRRMRQ